MPSLFYEAQFGLEISIELYDSMLSSPVSSYMYVLERYSTFYFIDLTPGLNHSYVLLLIGYLPIL